jgi:hypothetical protein
MVEIEKTFAPFAFFAASLMLMPVVSLLRVMHVYAHAP